VANAFDNYGARVNFKRWRIGYFTGDIDNHTIISAIASSSGVGGAGGGQWAAVFRVANGSNGFGADGKYTVNFDDWQIGGDSGSGDYAELTVKPLPLLLKLEVPVDGSFRSYLVRPMRAMAFLTWPGMKL
jgi:hypothetical protein